MKRYIALLCCFLVLVGALLLGQGLRHRLEKKAILKQMRLLNASLEFRELDKQVWDYNDLSPSLFPDKSQKAEISLYVQNRLSDLKKRVLAYNGIPRALGVKELLDESLPGTLAGVRYPEFQFTLIGAPTPENIRQLKIVFFGASQWRILRQGSNLAEYNPELNTIFLPAIRFTEASVEDAVVLHEVKHSQQIREMKKRGLSVKSALRLPDGPITDLGANLEVEATQLSGDILDAGSHGRYRSTLREIVKRKPAGSVRGLMLSLSRRDVVDLDEIFLPACPVEMMWRSFQYLFGLGREWILANVPVAEQPKAFRDLYRMLLVNHS